MIKNIIFDFGDVFINLDKEIIFREIKRYGGGPDIPSKLYEINNAFEIGALSSCEFVSELRSVYPNATTKEIIDVWNSMLLDFPDERLKFIEDLAQEKKYRLFLLSNTNALHIPYVERTMGHEKFRRFRNCFEQFYLSHEIQLRKPNADIYEFVLTKNKLKAAETFFVDDTKENTDAATKLGICCWNIQVGKEDIVQLKTKL